MATHGAGIMSRTNAGSHRRFQHSRSTGIQRENHVFPSGACASLAHGLTSQLALADLLRRDGFHEGVSFLH
jgi:hypothetical protein